MKPGDAAICPGIVMHRRLTPVEHRFTYPTTQVWIDPDRPGDLSKHHRLWSSRWPAPVQIRRQDYLDGGTGKMADTLRKLVQDGTSLRPIGPIRMLSQPRIWGWLFNPITLYFLWNDEDEPPAAAVLEVSNTPWKERHHYPVLLEPSASNTVKASFSKELHVSPFLGSDLVYDLHLLSPSPTKLTVKIDVLTQQGDPVLKTSMAVDRQQANRPNLTAALKNNPFPTHRVSKGIHTQAARLLAKKVPFVSHPKRTSTTDSRP